MKTYELVCVIDAGLATNDITTLKSKIEKEIPKIIVTDDMGIMPTMYPTAGQDQAYYISYHIQTEVEKLDEMKASFRLMKGLVKFVFYAMKENEDFLLFGDLQKSFDAIVAEEDARKQVRDTPEDPEEPEEEIIAGDVVEDEAEEEQTEEETQE